MNAWIDMGQLGTMISENLLTICGIVISVLTMVLLWWQIRTSVKLNRDNRTFEMISQLDGMMTDDKPGKEDIIKKIHLLDEFSPRVSLEEAISIYSTDKNRSIIYEILNFYETLALAVFNKNINKDILLSMYGYRIINAYEKLDPFISVIKDKYENRQSPPYQHFKLLYDKCIQSRWYKKYGTNSPRVVGSGDTKGDPRKSTAPGGQEEP